MHNFRSRSPIQRIYANVVMLWLQKKQTNKQTNRNESNHLRIQCPWIRTCRDICSQTLSRSTSLHSCKDLVSRNPSLQERQNVNYAFATISLSTSRHQGEKRTVVSNKSSQGKPKARKITVAHIPSVRPSLFALTKYWHSECPLSFWAGLF